MNSRGLLFVLVSLLLITIFLTGCSSMKNRRFEKKIHQNFQSMGFEEHFSGLVIYDPESQDTLVQIHDEKYFTPASNTKIFTLYTALKVLRDSLPMIKYAERGDTLFFTGTGNPANLHPYFRDSSMLKFLQGRKQLVYTPADYSEGRYGPGWAWEDYDGAYSPERSSLPLYGNVLTMSNADGLYAEPLFFKDSIRLIKNPWKREEYRNAFYMDPSRKDTLEIPLITGTSLTRELLEAALGEKVEIARIPLPDGKKILMGSVPTDSLYARMMKESDNFIAEQLLIAVSSALSDTLSSTLTRNFIQDSYLRDMRNPPRWVDGSGLSRYNLFTPGSMAFVLDKLLGEFGREYLFTIFPAGGREGTLENWYTGNPEPYVFAKSGTLGNTYCLSGYLITRSGKLLIFSFMNNHFREPTAEIKARMQRLLEAVRDAY